ncbi:putative DNA primase [uncultured virus]|uniref:DNA-directed DNA polymerase n=1 Tax=uncultured virus TaxID=340016 RepID=A0A218MM64_9VIRU|nr:putative DNA primase [uncultured virus]
MYKKCYAEYAGKNQYKIHLWEEDDYKIVPYRVPAYVECSEQEAEYQGLKGEWLKKTYKWDKDNPRLHFHDMPAYQKFLIEKYGIDDNISKGHREVFFDIEIEMGGALTEEYIQEAPKPVTSIAWYDRTPDEWVILILDKKNQIKHTKGHKEIIPCSSEEELLATFIEKFREINPDILVGWNSDYFDIPYLYFRISRVLGEDFANALSPIDVVKDESQWNRNGWLNIEGVESLDYMKLHKKFSFRDEPSMRLDAIGEKYVNLGKVEYDGNLDRLFEDDIQKFIQYNFRDVEILKELDEKFEYIGLVKNLSHKGKHNYGEVYANTKTQDGAISAYLLSQNIVPPSRDRNPIHKKGYAGGYLFCPKAGLYKYMFDEDLTSLYPSIIMSLNIGKETYVGRILDLFDDRNNRLGLNDLKVMDPEKKLCVENPQRKQTYIECSKIIETITTNNLAISANGVMFRTDKPSVLSTILAKWFDERVEYKGYMKKAYKAGDKEKGAFWHQRQHTMKILLNSLYGATALGSFRYGNVILSEAITLSGQRIIQESALCANRHMNRVIKNEIEL